MIDIRCVTKRYGTFTALEDITMHIEDGSVTGLVGCNGAGKSTLLKTAAGIYRPDGGEVKINGEPVFENPQVKKTMFFVPDELYFMPFADMDRMAKFYESYYPSFDRTTYRKLTEAFGLHPRDRIRTFSKGMQRQAETVFALSVRPKTLLLDESFDGLDPSKRLMMKNLLLEYAAQTGASVFISSHNLHELGDMCDRIAVLDGRHIRLDTEVDALNGSRYKFRAVCRTAVTEEYLNDIPHSNFVSDGKIFTFYTEDSDAEEKLLAKGALLVDRYPLSAEEIILSDMMQTEFDFTSIFGKTEEEST